MFVALFLLQTYTYSMQAVRDGSVVGSRLSEQAAEGAHASGAETGSQQSQAGAGTARGFEVRLLQAERLLANAHCPDTAEQAHVNTLRVFAAANFQVRLITEYMDLGTLRDALDRHVFFIPPTLELDFCSVLDTAADIAKGVEHLHSLNIVHGDLKVGGDIRTLPACAGRHKAEHL